MNSNKNLESVQSSNQHGSPEDFLYSIEHALGMYATSFLTIPAKSIYDKEFLTSHKTLIESCHIYIIGYLPKIEFIEAKQTNQKLSMIFLISNDEYILEYDDIPNEVSLKKQDGGYYMQNNSGEKASFDQEL